MHVWQTSLILVLGVFTTSACMLTSTHEKHMQEMQKELKLTKEALSTQCQTEKDSMQKSLAKTRNEFGVELAAHKTKLERVLGEHAGLASEKESLANKIGQLERMRTALQKRADDYQQLVGKLRKMMNAGTLQVKIRNGLMVVQLPSDILFAPGGIYLKGPANKALSELAKTLASFEQRRFQVVGHSDKRPIRTKRFPSNWELSTQRAVQVVKLLIKEGVRPDMISAAGAARFDPVADNETPEGREANRRVEITFVPKIDELPSFDQLFDNRHAEVDTPALESTPPPLTPDNSPTGTTSTAAAKSLSEDEQETPPTSTTTARSPTVEQEATPPVQAKTPNSNGSTKSTTTAESTPSVTSTTAATFKNMHEATHTTATNKATTAKTTTTDADDTNNTP